MVKILIILDKRKEEVASPFQNQMGQCDGM